MHTQIETMHTQTDSSMWLLNWPRCFQFLVHEWAASEHVWSTFMYEPSLAFALSLSLSFSSYSCMCIYVFDKRCLSAHVHVYLCSFFEIQIPLRSMVFPRIEINTTNNEMALALIIILWSDFAPIMFFYSLSLSNTSLVSLLLFLLLFSSLSIYAILLFCIEF